MSLDITHSFRSLPLLSIAVAQYLKVTKNVKIKKIVYGAFEARKENIAPVFDLTSFLDIVDWASSIREFTKFGNAEGIRDILTSIQRNAYINAAERLPLTLGRAGRNINSLTKALALTRPKDVIEASRAISRDFNDLNNEIVHFPQARPLSNILNVFTERYASFARYDQNNSMFSRQGFEIQSQMMQFYLDTEKYIQAITLAREVFVSYILVHIEGLNPQNGNDRNLIEKTLGTIAHSDEYSDWELYKIWREVAQVRNDINHAGMRENALLVQTATDKINIWTTRVMEFINQEIVQENLILFIDIMENLRNEQ